MRQATGKTNVREVSREVSIQLLLDGHSFSELPQARTTDGPQTIELLTARTLLVPAELADEERGGQLLAAAGLPLEEGECPLWVRSETEPLAAVMAVSRETLRRIEERYGNEARYSTPLLRPAATDRPAVWIHLAGGLLYIKVTDRGALQLAEALPLDGEGETHYLLAALGEEFPLAGCELHLSGDCPKSLLALFRKTFKRVTCES